MATYTQYMKARQDEVRRITWVCGQESLLKAEVVEHVRDRVDAKLADTMAYIGGESLDRDIWAQANTYPVDPHAKRLIIVHDAQRIKRWKPLKDWIDNSKSLPTTYLVFDSVAEDFTRGSDLKLTPPCEWIRHWSSGDLVNCSPLAATVPTKNGRPTRPGPSDAVAWVQNICPMPERVAEHLLTKCAGDLHRVKWAARKAALFEQEPTAKVIDLLGADVPEDDFVMRLVSMQKPEAMKAIPLIPVREYRRVLGDVEHRLNTVHKVHKLQRLQRTFKEASQVGLSPYAAKQVWDAAKYYDKRKQTHCRLLLARCDEDVQCGERTGVLEGLVALW